MVFLCVLCIFLSSILVVVDGDVVGLVGLVFSMAVVGEIVKLGSQSQVTPVA